MYSGRLGVNCGTVEPAITVLAVVKCELWDIKSAGYQAMSCGDSKSQLPGCVPWESQSRLTRV